MSYRQTDGRCIHVYSFPPINNPLVDSTTNTEFSEIADMVNTHTPATENIDNKYINTRVTECMAYIKRTEDFVKDKLHCCEGTPSQKQLYNQIVIKEFTTKFMNAKIADLCE